MSRWKLKRRKKAKPRAEEQAEAGPESRPARAFHMDGSAAIWLASCSAVGPGHQARVQAETARDARRKGAQALGVHHSVVNVALVG